jgi:transposase
VTIKKQRGPARAQGTRRAGRRARGYPSDLTDAQWQVIAPHLPADQPGRRGRPRVWPRRLIIEAILYLDRTGCAWRYLPSDFPPWQTVYGYFATWRDDGTLARLHDALRAQVRTAAGRDAEPTAASVRLVRVMGPRGWFSGSPGGGDRGVIELGAGGVPGPDDDPCLVAELAEGIAAWCGSIARSRGSDMPTHLPVFVLTTWLLAMLPGAGQALMLRQTLQRGRRAAWANIAGTCTGLLAWTSAAAAGLGVNTLLSLRRPAAPAAQAGPQAATGGRMPPGWRPASATPRPACSRSRCCPSS